MEYLLCRSTFFARLTQLVNFISPNYAHHEPTSCVFLFPFTSLTFSCPILQSMHSALCPSALVWLLEARFLFQVADRESDDFLFVPNADGQIKQLQSVCASEPICIGE